MRQSCCKKKDRERARKEELKRQKTQASLSNDPEEWPTAQKEGDADADADLDGEEWADDEEYAEGEDENYASAEPPEKRARA